jgi:phage head maturation protease
MTERLTIARAVPIIDMEIERGGDGRTVTAYAATFDDPYEVSDQYGRYIEEIDRAAFNRWLGMHGLTRTSVLFNHGFIPGTHTPSDRYSMPVGTPLEVKAEARGLLTRTRYAKTDLADEVLELIREGAIHAQSFRGDVFQSIERGVDPVAGLPRYRHTGLGLTDYGPARHAVNNGAEIVAVRSVAEQVGVTEEQVEQIAAFLKASSTQTETAAGISDGQDGTDDTAAQEPAVEAPPVDPAASVDFLELAAAQRRRRS